MRTLLYLLLLVAVVSVLALVFAGCAEPIDWRCPDLTYLEFQGCYGSSEDQISIQAGACGTLFGDGKGIFAATDFSWTFTGEVAEDGRATLVFGGETFSIRGRARRLPGPPVHLCLTVLDTTHLLITCDDSLAGPPPPCPVED